MGTVVVGIGGLILSALTYFAGVQRGKRYRTEDLQRHEEERKEDERIRLEAERRKKINDVLDRYRDLATKLESAQIRGLIRAGAISLSSEDILELCRLIEAEGLPHGISREVLEKLNGCDLVYFLRLANDKGFRITENHVFEGVIKKVQDKGLIGS